MAPSAPPVHEGSATVRVKWKYRPGGKPQGFPRLGVQPIEKTVASGPPAVSGLCSAGERLYCFESSMKPFGQMRIALLRVGSD